ncbi:MAG: cell envelope integrity protein TolA [Betaproteobacteria bacterium]
MRKDRPRKPARVSGQWPALALAVSVHVAFIAVLVFSLRWQNRKPEPITAELYAPPVKAATVVEAPPKRVEAPPPPPEPVPVPKAEPPPPTAAPKPEPKATPKPEPKAEKPDMRAADIARKAREDDERRKRDQAVRDRKEADQREADKRKQLEQQRLVEVRERQQRETDALKAQAEREQSTRATQQKIDADAALRARSEADYIRRIQSKVKGNVVLPPDMVGNAEAIFDVVQLPTGEIIDAVLRKSSGVRAYDDAVQRAIIKSSPLPRPERPDLFQRTLTLKFRPLD